jgi:hypothetical protein
MSVDDRLAKMLASEARIREMMQRESLNQGSGGGTSGGMDDDWKRGVDSQLAQLHSDVCNLLLGLIAGFLFLIGAGAAAYLRVSDQISSASTGVTELKGKAETLDTKIDLLVERSKASK